MSLPPLASPASPALSIVYLLTNPAMPGLVKIGRTTQEDAKVRLDQLYTTGVPVPFELAFAARVPNSPEVEDALHTAFAPHRINPRREFFQIDPEQAMAILRLLHVEDATRTVEQQPTTISQQEQNATKALRARRPNLDFTVLGIPVGAELHSVRGDYVATVEGPKRVTFQGESMSLTAATAIIAQTPYPTPPGPNWTYNGKTVRDIYREFYGEE